MTIERSGDVIHGFRAGIERRRLQALVEMRFEYVWECMGCGYFEPVYGRVRLRTA